MSIWNHQLNGNDTFQDIYQNFYELYRKGMPAKAVSDQLMNDFAAMFNDPEDQNSAWFALALAQWETQTVDPMIYDTVKKIIESGNDLTRWKSLGADEKMLRKREKELTKFLNKISSAKNRTRRIAKKPMEYHAILLVDVGTQDGKKQFSLQEVYVDQIYVQTGGMISWGTSGGSVLSFIHKNAILSARWIDHQTLEITHQANLNFILKEESIFCSGEWIHIRYLTL